MKKFLLFLLLSVVGMGFAFAQKDKEAKVEQRMKEVIEYKMKYLAQEMELSEVQKKKFFEVYPEMSQAQMQCYKSARELERKIKHDKNATEKDYQLVTEALNKANAEWAETEKKYNERYSEFLTQKQMYKMREAETSFRAKWEEMKHNRKKEQKEKK